VDYTHIHIFRKVQPSNIPPDCFQAGSPLVPAAWAVDRGVGFFVLFLGAAVVALGGILSLISRSNAEEATD
jgi:hypothetical protein